MILSLPGPLRSKMLVGVLKALDHLAWSTWNPMACFPLWVPVTHRPDVGWDDGDRRLPEDPPERWALCRLQFGVGLERTCGMAKGESCLSRRRKPGVVWGESSIQMVKMTVLGGHRSLEAAPTYQHPPPGGGGRNMRMPLGFPSSSPLLPPICFLSLRICLF